MGGFMGKFLHLLRNISLPRSDEHGWQTGQITVDGGKDHLLKGCRHKMVSVFPDTVEQYGLKSDLFLLLFAMPWLVPKSTQETAEAKHGED